MPCVLNTTLKLQNIIYKVYMLFGKIRDIFYYIKVYKYRIVFSKNNFYLFFLQKCASILQKLPMDSDWICGKGSIILTFPF